MIFNTYSNFCPHLMKFLAQLLKCPSILWICIPATKHHTVSSKSNHNNNIIIAILCKNQTKWEMKNFGPPIKFT